LIVYVPKYDYILAIQIPGYVAEFYYTLEKLFDEEGFIEYIEIYVKDSVVDFDVDLDSIIMN